MNKLSVFVFIPFLMIHIAAFGLNCNITINNSTEKLRKENLQFVVMKARIFAKSMHQGQYRKFDKKPYFVHPARVAKIVRKVTNDPELIAAAYLHDTLEDTVATRKILIKKFGVRIANLVEELTSNPDNMAKFESKAAYLVDKMLKMSNDALLIKLADRLDNTSDFETASSEFIAKYRAETNYILSHLVKRKNLSPKHLQLIDRIYRAMKDGETAHKARLFAEEHHSNQKRKNSDLDYIVHPTRVSKELNKSGASIEERTAAYLKDVLDKGEPRVSIEEIKEQFGPVVSHIVVELNFHTNKISVHETRMTVFEKQLDELSDSALLILTAGRIDNLQDIHNQKSSDEFREYISESLILLVYLKKSQREYTDQQKYFIRKLERTLNQF